MCCDASPSPPSSTPPPSAAAAVEAVAEATTPKTLTLTTFSLASPCTKDHELSPNLLVRRVLKEFKFAVKEKSYLYKRTSQSTNSRWCTPKTIHITKYVNCTTVEIITRFTSLSCRRTNFCNSRNCQCDCPMVWCIRVSTVYKTYQNM